MADPDWPDLFGYEPKPRYPDEPGFKEGDTSREAAEDMALRAGTLRRRAYDFIVRHPHYTADEIAAALGETVLAIRPRISELRNKGLIVNDGRGTNSSGKAAHLWVAKEPARRERAG
jgi:predicted ArsR family transcriptional regulator